MAKYLFELFCIEPQDINNDHAQPPLKYIHKHLFDT